MERRPAIVIRSLEAGSSQTDRPPLTEERFDEQVRKLAAHGIHVPRRSTTVSHVSPNQPRTKGRSVRIPLELWKAAQAVARKRGETVSDVIRRALTEYVEEGEDK